MKLQKSIIAIIALFIFALTADAQTQYRNKLDYTGDHKADAALFRGRFADGRTEFLALNSANPANYSAINWGVMNTDRPVTGDFDGDGRGDYAITRTEGSNTSWYILNSNGTSYRRVVFGLPLDTTNEVTVVADYDGDGKDDVAIARRNSANNTFTYYWLRSIDGQLGTRIVASNPAYTNCRASVPGDYIGDNKADFIIRCRRASDNQMFFDITDNGSNATQNVKWGLFTGGAADWSMDFYNGDVFVPGDYDGDGKTDVAVVRFEGTQFDGSLFWYIRRSSNGTTYVRQFGAMVPNAYFDRPIPADYDGDGKTDLAVVRFSPYEPMQFISENSLNGASRWLQFGVYDFETYVTTPLAMLSTSSPSVTNY